MNIIFFVLGFLYSYLCDLVVEPIRRKWRKDCGFNCSKCKVFDCLLKKGELKNDKKK